MNAFAGETADTASASSTEAAGCYKLTSETTEGPYHIDADKIRQDIIEDKEGIPLTLKLKVIDSETCKPIRDAAVDIWHADALGVYSGYESLSSGGGSGPTGAPSGTPTECEAIPKRYGALRRNWSSLSRFVWPTGVWWLGKTTKRPTLICRRAAVTWVTCRRYGRRPCHCGSDRAAAGRPHR